MRLAFPLHLFSGFVDSFGSAYHAYDVSVVRVTLQMLVTVLAAVRDRVFVAVTRTSDMIALVTTVQAPDLSLPKSALRYALTLLGLMNAPTFLGLISGVGTFSMSLGSARYGISRTATTVRSMATRIVRDGHVRIPGMNSFRPVDFLLARAKQPPIKKMASRIGRKDNPSPS